MSNAAMRMTQQRRLALEELQRVPCHPTADELYDRLRKQMPRISLGTVYRNLEILCRSGLAKKLVAGGHQARFDGMVTPHSHVHCVRCGRVADVKTDPLPDLAARAVPAEGYKILDCRLEFAGICRNCQKHDHGSGRRGPAKHPRRKDG